MKPDEDAPKTKILGPTSTRYLTSPKQEETAQKNQAEE